MHKLTGLYGGLYILFIFIHQKVAIQYNSTMHTKKRKKTKKHTTQKNKVYRVVPKKRIPSFILG